MVGLMFTAFASRILIVLLWAGPANAQEPCRRVREFNVDPVELLKGKEVAGDTSHTQLHGLFTYRFASAQNKAEFLREPAKYEVQLGGSCARMGPLSGIGRGDIFAVYDGRIFVFASKQCREGFLKSPEKLLERDDAPIQADEAARKRGRELIDLAVKYAGGERVDQVKTIRGMSTRIEKQSGKAYKAGGGLVLAFPDRIRREESWDEWIGGEVLVGERAWFIDNGGDDPHELANSQYRAIRRIANRNPLVILRSRNGGDFAAAARGPGEEGAERVEVFFDGCATTLHIDGKSGAIRAIEYAGRGPNAALGRILLAVTATRTSAGVTLPSSWAATFDGKRSEPLSAELTTFEVDGPVKDEEFKPKPAKKQP